MKRATHISNDILKATSLPGARLDIIAGDLTQDSQDIRAICKYIGHPVKGVTGAVKDGDYLRVWLTDSPLPCLASARYTLVFARD